jgi:hypothetical protein
VTPARRLPRILIPLVVALALSAVLLAPIWASLSRQLSGPTMGFVWDATVKGIRRIKGVPGAAVAELPYYSDQSLITAAISPDQSSALLLNSEGSLLWTQLQVMNGPIPISSGLPLDTRIVFSPSGTSAFLFQSNPGQLLLVTGLPDRPAVRTLQAPELSGPIVVAAVSDSDVVLIAQAAQIFVLNINRPATFLMNIGEAGGMQFLRRKNDALITDRQANTLSLLRNVNGALDVSTVAGANDGLHEPTLVASSSDNLSAWVANAADKLVIRISLAQSRRSITSNTNARITAIEPLHGRNIFRLTGVADGRLMVLDGDSGVPRAVPVPVRTGGLTQQ